MAGSAARARSRAAVAYAINPATNTSPMWRFRNLQNGSYLWSADPAERANINAKFSALWKEEGVSYYLAP